MDELHLTALELRILAGIVAKIAGRALEQRLHEQGIAISGLQYGLMRLLVRQQHTISELSRTMLLTPATLVPAVDTLERHGLVVRGHDPADRRRTPLALTERGAAVLARVPAVHADDLLVQALAALGPAKCEQLLALLRELLGALPDSHESVGEIERAIRRMADQPERSSGAEGAEHADDPRAASA